jgi:hypothetical protein
VEEANAAFWRQPDIATAISDIGSAVTILLTLRAARLVLSAVFTRPAFCPERRRQFPGTDIANDWMLGI